MSFRKLGIRPCQDHLLYGMFLCGPSDAIRRQSKLAGFILRKHDRSVTRGDITT